MARGDPRVASPSWRRITLSGTRLTAIRPRAGGGAGGARSGARRRPPGRAGGSGSGPRVSSMVCRGQARPSRTCIRLRWSSQGRSGSHPSTEHYNLVTLCIERLARPGLTPSRHRDSEDRPAKERQREGEMGMSHTLTRPRRVAAAFVVIAGLALVGSGTAYANAAGPASCVGHEASNISPPVIRGVSGWDAGVDRLHPGSRTGTRGRVRESGGQASRRLPRAVRRSRRVGREQSRRYDCLSI